MPRGIRPRAAIFVKTTPPKLFTKPLKPLDGDGARLWNAKRRIRSSKGLELSKAKWLTSKAEWVPFKAESVPSKAGWLSLNFGGLRYNWPNFERWREHLKTPRVNGLWWRLDSEKLPQFMEEHPDLQKLSPDVKAFIQKGSFNFTRPQILRLLANPAQYFSYTTNVPMSVRKQVYFPNISDDVVLIRTPHLGPRYACFRVPLHFDKLELKAYLRDVYKVDVLHIRSVVVQHKVERRDGRNQYSQGAIYRPPSQKKMTCLLAQPFVYPEAPADFENWEHTDYWKAMKAIVTDNREDPHKGEWLKYHPDYNNRTALALQAQQLLKGKATWAPTWQNFVTDRKAMRGLQEAAPGAVPPPAQELTGDPKSIGEPAV